MLQNIFIVLTEKKKKNGEDERLAKYFLYSQFPVNFN